MSKPDGYFEAFINQNVQSLGGTERALMKAVTELCRAQIPKSQLHWAGSQRKKTAIKGSDLDFCLESSEPVTVSQRKLLRSALESGLGRPAVIRSHVVRLPKTAATPKVDVAFANAAFGSRPLPDPGPFHNQKSRQLVARALKLWTRGGGLPHLPGWVVEAIVIHLDPNPGQRSPLELFQHIVGWLERSATPSVLEGVLRPEAFPRWNPQWSKRLPGRIQSLQGHARALSRSTPSPATWRSPDDVGRWLSQ